MLDEWMAFSRYEHEELEASRRRSEDERSNKQAARKAARGR
jgi:hypothetical protein